MVNVDPFVVALLWIVVVALGSGILLLLLWCLALRANLAAAVRERDFYAGLAIRLRESGERRSSPAAEQWTATIRPGSESES